MSQLTNKIQIPIKTKLAAGIIYIISWIALSCFSGIFVELIPFFIASILIYKKKTGLYWGGTVVFFVLVGLILVWNNFDARWTKINYYEIFLAIISWAFFLFIAGRLVSLKKYAWWAAISAFLLLNIFCVWSFLWLIMFPWPIMLIILLIGLLVIFVFVPFLFLILDQKNYFAAVERAKNEIKKI